MVTTTISLPVDSKLAVLYEKASAEDQYKMQLLIAMYLKSLTSSGQESLTQIMDVISDKAQANGLTQATLDNLLNDDN